MKTVIVTGASRGIGAAVVADLRISGVKVIGVARDGESLKKQSLLKYGNDKSPSFDYVVGDVSEPATITDAIKLAGGSLDGLILNAGILEPINEIAKVSMKDFER